MTGLRSATLAVILLIGIGPASADGLMDKAKDAVDPDCTVGKAAKGAARKAVVGVRGNRCDVGETARDTLGIDDREQKDREWPKRDGEE